MSEKKDESVIPRGCYCYSGSRAPGESSGYKPCPYWKIKLDRVEGQTVRIAMCSFLDIDETMDSCFLLADQVKMCGINYENGELDEE